MRVTDTNGFVADVRPVNGAITFVIDSDAADQVRPVIFLDADNGSAEAVEGTATVDLDLDANNLPLVAEAFGIGGQKNFVAPAATAGPIATAEMRGITLYGSQFSTAAFNYTLTPTTSSRLLARR